MKYLDIINSINDSDFRLSVLSLHRSLSLEEDNDVELQNVIHKLADHYRELSKNELKLIVLMVSKMLLSDM